MNGQIQVKAVGSKVELSFRVGDCRHRFRVSAEDANWLWALVLKAATEAAKAA